MCIRDRTITNPQQALYNLSLSLSHTHTHTRPSPVIPAKFPKNIDKKDFTSSSRFNEVSGLIYIYRIMMQKMTGRNRSESISSLTNSQTLHRSGSDEDAILGSRTSVSEIISEESALDFVSPILEDMDRPLMMASFGSKSPPDTGMRNGDSNKLRWDSKNSLIFYENVGFSDGVNQTVVGVPRRRTKVVSGRSWNNCIPEYAPFPTSSSNSHSMILSPQSSNGSNGGDTASILSSDSRLGQASVVDLVCSSPESGVHDDYSQLSTHNHSVASSASCKLTPPPLPPKSVHSRAILVNEGESPSHQSTTTTGTLTNQGNPASDPRLKLTRHQTTPPF